MNIDEKVCPTCGRKIKAKMDGRLRMHGRERDTGSRWRSCTGTDKLPITYGEYLMRQEVITS